MEFETQDRFLPSAASGSFEVPLTLDPLRPASIDTQAQGPPRLHIANSCKQPDRESCDSDDEVETSHTMRYLLRPNVALDPSLDSKGYLTAQSRQGRSSFSTLDNRMQMGDSPYSASTRSRFDRYDSDPVDEGICTEEQAQRLYNL
jgi:hypothetical protein